MVFPLQSPTVKAVIYPEDDGQPISDNTEQFRWIMVIYSNLDWLFADSPSVFVAGNLLWYPVEGNPTIRQAPDVMVIFGVNKGDRGSYKQWEEGNIVPQVVFEILSPGNTQTEMSKKLLFYDRYGVEEYYIYDPQKNELSGLLRSQERLEVIEEIDNWVSPRLGIRFDLSGETLQIYRPNGEAFATYLEVQKQLEETKVKAEQAEQRLKEAEELLKQYRERFGEISPQMNTDEHR